jgi:two-component system sensor kinase FixL
MRELIATGASQLTEERVSSMVDDLRPLFDLIRQETGIAVRIDVDTTGDRVLADRIQFQQAITNLVRNAVDAVGDHPGAVVSLTGRSLADEGYEIRIEDNGPGIAEDQMDRIFQPMMTTKAGGMGLGLSVTRSIIESHDAALAVGRSALGGAAFSFRLTPVTELEAA